MNYSAPEILVQLNQLLLAQSVTMHNRTLINALANGDPPYTAQEQRDENIYTNVNFLELTRICSNATNQIDNTFEKGERYFTIRANVGPIRLRSYNSSVVTKEINKLLKRERPYRAARKSARAQVVLHGPGPLMWRDNRTPTPGTVGIEDILIPNGTLCDMENLDRFGVYQEMTWPQLEKAALGPVVDQGWNLPYVKQILQNLYKTGYVPTYYGNRWMFPEKLQEDYKEGAARAFSSSLPKALVWNFFFRNEDTGKWNRRMLLDYANGVNMGFIPRDAQDMEDDPRILYERDNYAEDWSSILHFSIGNCSNVAPFRYHSIRSMGYLLFAISMLQNKIRCRWYDHISTELLTLLRNVSEDNREKLGLIDLQNFGIIPDGVSFLPAAERHTADYQLIMAGLSQNRQLMSESSSSFLPDMESAVGMGKEMTASEAIIRQNTSVTLTSAVTNMLVQDSVDEYREICRRFCLKNNPHPMAKAFRESIQKQGVPLDVLDVEEWDIVPEQGMGGGNKAAEMMGTQALMQEVYPLVDAQGQRLILRKRISAITDNPEEALMMVPEAPDMANDDMQYAQVAFAVLSNGTPFADKEGANHVVMAVVLMQLTQQALQTAEAVLQQPEGLSIAAQKITGATNVLQHVQQEIAKIAQANSQKELAKKLGKQWEMLNAGLQQLAKQFMAAEEQKQQQQQPGVDPKTMTKIQEMQLTAQANRQIATQNADQKREQKQISWSEENARRNASTAADAHRKMALTHTDIAATDLKTRAEILQGAMAGDGGQEQ